MRARLFALAFVLCASPVFAQVDPTKIIERQIVVQGSIGQPGRELAFLNCFNPDPVDVGVSVEFRGNGSMNVGHQFVIHGPDRASINLAEIPFMPTRAYFAVDIIARAADGEATAIACTIAWHRASDLAEVASVDAVTRRSPKR